MEYFFDQSENGNGNHSNVFRFCAVIDAAYFVEVTWSWESAASSAQIISLFSGSITPEISERNNTALNTDVHQLRQKFSSFAYFLERTAEGFRSYIQWIRPVDRSPEWVVKTV